MDAQGQIQKLGQMSPEETAWLLEAFHRMGYYNPDVEECKIGLKDVTLVRAKAGDVLLRQGEPADRAFIVRKGRLAVTRRLPDGKEVRLAELGEFSVAGEMALVEGRPRSATVAVAEDAELFLLSRNDFDFLMKSCDVFRQIIETLVAERTRYNTQRIGG